MTRFRFTRTLVCALLATPVLLAGGCARDDASPWPEQRWEDVVIGIETRPLRVTEPGIVEFLVVARREPRAPASNLLINIRTDEEGRWHQAIQDGNLGVYRRAVPVQDPEDDVLQVRIEYDNRVGIMHFPLAVPEPTIPAPG